LRLWRSPAAFVAPWLEGTRGIALVCKRKSYTTTLARSAARNALLVLVFAIPLPLSFFISASTTRSAPHGTQRLAERHTFGKHRGKDAADANDFGQLAEIIADGGQFVFPARVLARLERILGFSGLDWRTVATGVRAKRSDSTRIHAVDFVYARFRSVFVIDFDFCPTYFLERFSH